MSQSRLTAEKTNLWPNRITTPLLSIS